MLQIFQRTWAEEEAGEWCQADACDHDGDGDGDGEGEVDGDEGEKKLCCKDQTRELGEGAPAGGDWRPDPSPWIAAATLMTELLYGVFIDEISLLVRTCPS